MGHENESAGDTPGTLTLGHIIERERKSRGLTQGELGKMLNTTGAAVGNWERGGTIAEDNFLRLKEIFDLSDATPEMMGQIGRQSRKRPSHTVDLFDASREGNPETTTTTPPSRKRVIFEPIGPQHPTRLPKTQSDNKNRPTQLFYEAFAEELGPKYADNINVTVSIHDQPYQFDYYSDKLAIVCEVQRFMIQWAESRYEIPVQVHPMPFSGSASSLWKLAVAKRLTGMKKDFVFAVQSDGPNLASSKAFQQRFFEGHVMGLRFLIAENIPSLAAAIIHFEEDRLPDTEDDVYTP